MEGKSRDCERLISELKMQGRETEIQTELKKLGVRKVDKTLAFVEGALFDDYLHDMSMVQRYAYLNRKAIVWDIVKKMKLKVREQYTTIHNYIDLDSMIILHYIDRRLFNIIMWYPVLWCLYIVQTKYKIKIAYYQ